MDRDWIASVLYSLDPRAFFFKEWPQLAAAKLQLGLRCPFSKVEKGFYGPL